MNSNDGWIGLQKIISKDMGETGMVRLDDKVVPISCGQKNQGAAEAPVFTAECAKGIYGRLDVLTNNVAILIPRIPTEERTME